MKKIIIFFILFGITFFTLNASPIDVTTAKKVAENYFKSKGFLVGKSSTSFELIYKEDRYNTNILKSETNLAYYYVFSVQPQGFVIVAGDNNVVPILGYSNENNFVVENKPINLAKWLDGYKNEIRYIVENNVLANDDTKNLWERYLSKEIYLENNSEKAVSALISTKWDQGQFYNNLCPGTGNNKSVTGCVATAMAQILKYWEQPTTGTGFHSYNSQNYGTLNANFGSTNYSWSDMPNQLTSSSSSTQKTAVATLMYHCGVAVDMQYGSASIGGSSAYVISAASATQHCSEYALKTYFNYKTTMQGKLKNNFTDNQWVSMLKTDLDAGRPILYAGFGDGGHAFVCDGYDNSNKFHFNWGWSGQNDGYFALNALNPGSGGAGGGSYNFTNNQQALLGIEPINSVTPSQNFDLSLYSSINMSSYSIWFGSSISISVKIVNNGTTAFQGTFCAAVFNSEGIFIDFLSTSSQTLSSGYYVEKTFTNAGGPPFIPGNYIVAVFYKTANNEWKIVADGYYSNHKEFEIYYYAAIETNSNFSIQNNGGHLTQGQDAIVNVDVLNDASNIFYGKYRVNLANLDGSWAQNIQVLNETNGLSPGYHYISGNNFSGTITVEPGTYLLEIAYQRNGESNWYYAGSRNFSNPVFVIVEAAEIQPDQYEENNTESKAYNFNASFSNNSATVKTTGSNFHVGNDIDFYKITLPAGYKYTLTPRLHDSDNSGNGNNYSVDALFAYKIGNSAWSETYDNVMPNNITITNGGTIYFKVAPYFSGNSGTYLLDIPIKRTSTTNIDNNNIETNINVFPNPTKDEIYIKSEFQIQKVEIYNLTGSLVITENNFLGKISVAALSQGVYTVKIYTNNCVSIEKIVINK